MKVTIYLHEYEVRLLEERRRIGAKPHLEVTPEEKKTYERAGYCLAEAAVAGYLRKTKR